jgi:hypothetical protein
MPKLNIKVWQLGYWSDYIDSGTVASLFQFWKLRGTFPVCEGFSSYKRRTTLSLFHREPPNLLQFPPTELTTRSELGQRGIGGEAAGVETAHEPGRLTQCAQQQLYYQQTINIKPRRSYVA